MQASRRFNVFQTRVGVWMRVTRWSSLALLTSLVGVLALSGVTYLSWWTPAAGTSGSAVILTSGRVVFLRFGEPPLMSRPQFGAAHAGWRSPRLKCARTFTFTASSVEVMLWWLVAIGLVFAGVSWRAWRWLPPIRRRGRLEAGLCPRCSYDLRREMESGCPECGWNRDSTPPGPLADDRNRE